MGETYVGLTINDTITRLDSTVPDDNLYNHSPYPSIEDLVQHATGEPWVQLGDSGSTWRGATGRDQLFMAAVQAYFSQVRCSQARETLHPMSLEWETLIEMATLDNRDPPPPLLKQAFRHAAGLAVNLLEALDNQTHCHRLLATDWDQGKQKHAALVDFTKKKLVALEKKVILPLVPIRGITEVSHSVNPWKPA
jgi:hypothetical protein